MFNGKTKRALEFLSCDCKGNQLSSNDFVDVPANTAVQNVLKSKHPPAAPLYRNTLIINSDPVIFEALDGAVIRAAALHTTSAAEPSGLDAYRWR